MNSIIYLDNSATTKPCDTAIEYINNALKNSWGNPSSLYDLGVASEVTIDSVREDIASIIDANENEIYFTGSGTEANNIAILGAANALKRRGNKIVTTSVEHPSVLNTMKHLEENGFEVTYIAPEADGHILAEKFISAIDEKTILVSVMLVNNETGAIFPVSEMAMAAKEINKNIIVHSDCVQAFGKLPISVDDLGCDLISASAHKIHGPKGVGFLYKSKKCNIKPIIFGGGQENGLRSGTESVPLIAGLGGALKELKINENYKKVEKLYNYAVEKLSSLEEVTINSPKTNFLPYILNISVKGYRSETLLHFLESKKIYVSSGSACAKGKGSYVLTEMGLSPDRTDSALRISFSKLNEKQDIDILLEKLKLATKTLRKNRTDKFERNYTY